MTHYYFEDCAHYTPMASMPALGSFAFWEITDISTGQPVENTLMGRKVARSDIERLAFRPKIELEGFDSDAYRAANPDVAASGIDPRLHYEQYGRQEGRPLG